jgi:hypothetical protein
MNSSHLDPSRTALDGLPNHAAAPTEYADLYYNTIANSICLVSSQSTKKSLNGHSENSPHLNGTDSQITGQIRFRLVPTLLKIGSFCNLWYGVSVFPYPIYIAAVLLED